MKISFADNEITNSGQKEASTAICRASGLVQHTLSSSKREKDQPACVAKIYRAASVHALMLSAFASRPSRAAGDVAH